jgi:hypothetical protein
MGNQKRGRVGSERGNMARGAGSREQARAGRVKLSGVGRKPGPPSEH